jgi:hypothetical protein
VTSNCNLHEYALRIDGPLLASQRQLLLKVMDIISRSEPYRAADPSDEEHLQGILSLLDEIADQAHDRHGLDSLMKPDASEDGFAGHNRYRCECEKPGYFFCGVPGILAHLDNGKLPGGAKVERCDFCRRIPSDEAALAKLQDLGIAPDATLPP